MPTTESLARVAGLLACPHCSSGMRVANRAVACSRGHSFDIARQGYVNLLGRAAPRNADTTEMVAARDAFLATGHYLPIREAVVAAVGDATTVVEVGAGTGWYLTGVLDALPDALGIATDVSVPASRRAARAHPRMAAMVADTWAGLPLATAGIDAVVCVFAPRNAREFSRVLRPGGRLVVAAPGPDHMAELRRQHGLLSVDGDKLASVSESLAEHFSPSGTAVVRETLDLTAADASALVAMGPNAFHGVPQDVGGGAVTLDVVVAAFDRS